MQDSIRKSRLATLVGALVAALTATSAIVFLTAAPAQASTRYGYAGFSHGTLVLGGLANSGPQVGSWFGCTRTVGLKKENKLANVDAPGAIGAHTVATKTESHNDSRGDGVTSIGNAGDISIGNLLSITGVQTFARAVHTTSGYQTQAYSKFGGITILGIPAPNLLNPAPNTTVQLPGLGYMQLNRQEFYKTPQSATAKTVAVLIKSTVANDYLPLGATVGILVTGATVGGPGVAVLRGQAYTTQANVGTLVTSGQTSPQTTCVGTNGVPKTVNVAGITIPSLATVNALSTTSVGTIRTDLVSGNMTSRIGSVSLLGGRVELGAISVRSSATKTAAGKYYVSYTSSIASLKVDGKSMAVPLPGRTLTIPGLATITFTKVTKTSGFISVTAVEVKVPSLNTTLTLAHAESGIIS